MYHGCIGGGVEAGEFLLVFNHSAKACLIVARSSVFRIPKRLIEGG